MIIDNAYTCNCEKNKDFILDCGHSFCVLCIAIIRWKATFEQELILVKQPSKRKNDCLHIRIMCPTCLALTEISKSSM